ncbi:hypothetical protein ElyMa_001154900 [Elysia marginata]|uniref:Uncharacterized protein n=1 Tax=Elysia marginata TaxID=1093978 RepID=A0AAV4I159_9GAST|nr:hypothetical protein ElyMa_001154900 [Elysia marginata]
MNHRDRQDVLTRLSDREMDEETRRQKAHLKELEDHLTEEERQKEAKRQKYIEEKEKAAEQKRQQRERERAKERGKRESNVSGISKLCF